MVYKSGKNRKYGAANPYAGDTKVCVPLLADLAIDLGEVFAE